MKVEHVPFPSEEVRKIEKACFPKDELYSSFYPVNAWILRDDSKALGFAYLTMLEHNMAFMSRAGILKTYRGKNLQRKLIYARERYARKNGIKVVITYTTYSNCASSNNLISCGYKVYTPEEFYVGTNVLYWKKSL